MLTVAKTTLEILQANAKIGKIFEGTKDKTGIATF